MAFFPIQQTLKDTRIGGTFLRYADYIDESETKALLVFCSKFGANLLNNSNVWVSDGTFTMPKGLFVQLYVVHCQAKDGIAYPAIYGMFTDRSAATYHQFFSILKEIADKGPEFVVVDLELAPMSQYNDFWPEAVVEGCEFHVRRAFRENMGAKGILSAYNGDPHLQYVIDLFKALIFAPHDQIPRLFEDVVDPLFGQTLSALENDEPIDEHRIVLPAKYDSTNFPVMLSEYFTYLETYYIGAQNRTGKRRKAAYPPELWSKYNAVLAGRYRTSNSAENWHRQVQSSLNKFGSIWKFLDWLSQVQSL